MRANGASRLALRLEPAALEQFAFEGREEALAQGVVIGIADRTHRGSHTGLTTAVAELDRGVLRTLVGVVDHAPGSPCHERHVQSIEHQSCGERGGHRPANDAAAEGVEHHREIEKTDRKSTRLNSSHPSISYAVFCLKKKNA